MRRVAVAAATILALAVAGCGNKDGDSGSGGEAANWPQRDLRIMAPADPGGGWDTTARVMGQTLSQSQGSRQEQAGKSNELMVMGLVMPGAIETNKSPVDPSKTTPIAALTSVGSGGEDVGEVDERADGVGDGQRGTIRQCAAADP